MSIVMDISLLTLRLLLFFRLFAMCTFVPIIEHRRDAIFPMSAPWAVMVPPTPSPARTPKKKAEGSQRDEEQEQR
jgi:hypothetical protein